MFKEWNNNKANVLKMSICFKILSFLGKKWKVTHVYLNVHNIYYGNFEFSSGPNYSQNELSNGSRTEPWIKLMIIL